MMEIQIIRPLNELEQVDWANLEDAYGPATGTPELLRRWATGDENARFGVFSFLWHQGTVYSATAYAVPFMLGVLAQQPQMVLEDIEMLAQGHGYYLVHAQGKERQTPEMQATFRKEQGWIDAARQAVERGADLYRPYLTDSNPEIRRAAVRVLALCVQRRPEVLDWLLEALAQETDSDLQALYLEMSYRHGFGPQMFVRLPTLEAQEGSLLQFWLSVLKVQSKGSATPQAIQTLLDDLAQQESFDDYAADSYIDPIVAELLKPLGYRDQLAQAILSREDIFADPYTFLGLFSDAAPWQPEQLHPLLRKFLEQYAAQDFMILSLKDYGLPVFMPKDVGAWLGSKN